MIIPEIKNFGQVSDTLFRGAQPDMDGYLALKDAGIDIDIDVRSPYPQQAEEQEMAEQAGLTYKHIYWRAGILFSTPEMEDVLYFLSIVRAKPGKKIFVHCKQGSDRTGVCVAAYRIAMEGWSAKSAAAEMDDYGYHWYLFPRWKGWVEKLTPEMLK